MTALQKKYGPEGLVVLAVNAWDEPKSDLQRFADEKKLSHQILLDGSSVAKGKYGVSSIPVNLWIDKQGTVVHRADGFDEKHVNDMDTWTRRILK